MREYRYDNVPVEHLKTEDIEALLRNGITFRITPGNNYAQEKASIIERLKLELFIRQRNLRAQI